MFFHRSGLKASSAVESEEFTGESIVSTAESRYVAGERHGLTSVRAL
jgi:hypothetical protein